MLLGRNLNLEHTLNHLPLSSLNALADHSRPINHCRSEQSLDLYYLKKLEAPRTESERNVNINESKEGVSEITDNEDIKPDGLASGDCVVRSCSSNMSNTQRTSCR